MNSEVEILKISYGNREIPVNLYSQDRKTFSVEVSPNLEVAVKVPNNIPREQILYKINKRKSWIYNQVCYFEELQSKLKEYKYISGETFLLLGKEYILKIRNNKEKNSVNIEGNNIIVNCNGENSVKDIIDEWYKLQAYDVFKKTIKSVLPLFKNQDIKPKGLRIRKMNRRWGSCSKNGIITLNIDLVKAPIGCIKYVMAHECCHLVEFYHNRRFYELLEYVMPDWEKQKLRLEILLG